MLSLIACKNHKEATPQQSNNQAQEYNVLFNKVFTISEISVSKAENLFIFANLNAGFLGCDT